MTAIVGIVIYKIITFYFTEEPREQREPKDTEYETMSTLIGILVDVSNSMRDSVDGRVEADGGKWAKSIFKVVDELIKHDVSSSNQTFALAFGSPNCEVFDLLNTVRKANQEVSKERAEIEDIKARASNCVDEVRPILVRKHMFKALTTLEENGAPRVHKHEDKIRPILVKKHMLNEALTILEENGAPRVRYWGKMDVLLKVVDDDTAAAVLYYLKKDCDFMEKFVFRCLPRECREFSNSSTETVYAIAGKLPIFGSNLQSWGTEESVQEAIEKGKRLIAETRRRKAAEFQVVDVSNVAIMSVHDASEILHVSVGDQELTNERVDELLETIEPLIYGLTPLMKAMHHSLDLFSYEKFADHKKLLFILSDGMPTDADENDPPLENLSDLGVTVVSCFITNQKLSDPRHLYSIEDECWQDPAKFMFGMSSTITTQKIPRTLFVKRGWKIDIDNNETRLFFQVNHPDLVREVCDMAKKGVLSQDALSDMLSTVDLDLYINRSNDRFGAKRQYGGTCYANASAAVLHLAMKRIIGRDGGYPDFFKLRSELISKYGKHGAPTKRVLEDVCPKYRLECKEVNAIGAMEAVSAKRPVVARFYLSGAQWDQFYLFYEEYPKRILTRSYLDSKLHSERKPGGHAVVLTSYDAESLRLMNSWGDDWADSGFFRVQNANTLPGLTFYDVFWTLDSLSQKEKKAYKQQGPKTAAKLMRSLQGLQEARYKCPLCSVESRVVGYSGHLLRAKCPTCSGTFNANKEGGDLALNLYLTSLMH